MYCKHCGKEIADDSKFCQHCGKSQDSSGNSLSNKPMWIIYLIWAISNLYLLMGSKEYDASEYFFPSLDDVPWNKDYYDFSEFIFYVFIIPAILYIIYRLYRKSINKLVNRILKNR